MLDRDHTVEDLGAVEILDGVPGTLRRIINDGGGHHRTSEVVLVDPAELQSALLGEQFLSEGPRTFS